MEPSRSSLQTREPSVGRRLVRRKPAAADVAQITDTLVSLGCLIAADAARDSAAPGGKVEERFVAAQDFNALRQLLAAAAAKCAPNEELRSLHVFETLAGGMGSAPGVVSSSTYAPSAEWEPLLTQHLGALPTLGAMLKYHAADEVQKALLAAADINSFQRHLTTFLLHDLLPRITTLALEPLLLKLLEEAQVLNAAEQAHLRQQPLVFLPGASGSPTDARLLPASRFWEPPVGMPDCIKRLVDPAGQDFFLLPAAYAAPVVLRTLAAVGLQADLSAPIFKYCVQRFVAKAWAARELDEEAILATGIALAQQLTPARINDLSRHAVFWQDSNSWQTYAGFLLTTRFIPMASLAGLPKPYSLKPWRRPASQPQLTSFAEAEDHEHYALVYTAVPVINAALTDLKETRTALGQVEPMPRLENVLNHLVKLACPNGGIADQCRDMRDNAQALGHLLTDTERAYKLLLAATQNPIGYAVPLGQGGSVSRLIEKKLARKRWVLLPDSYRFVKASELCFNLQPGQSTPGMYPVPPALQAWDRDLLKRLGACDALDGAPVIAAPQGNPVRERLARGSIADDFNDPKWADAMVALKGCENRPLHLHRVLVAPHCESLAARWSGPWDETRRVTIIDGRICPACGIEASYGMLVTFLRFFYTGEVTLQEPAPEGKTRVDLLAELLALADCYGVPFILHTCEYLLRPETAAYRGLPAELQHKVAK
ncbi:hypothetical protein WJX72_007518 [[Myrmecia] bisecta]|uniref:BTB domain-containing protein n=1 Tax=[Myrmecia] bisecta TaxID=41462 RepID=A0AAW1P6H7_9CHLO